MKKLLIYLSHDETTNKFSTSKFMVLVTFYFILFITAKALYFDREIKNVPLIENTFIICVTNYFGRRFTLKTKNMEASSSRASATDKESE